MVLEEDLQLNPTQILVATDKHRFRTLCCGRRWGKTTLAIDQIKARASIPNARICYVAPTYQQARDIAWEQLKNDCRQASEIINESRLEIRLVNGSIIFLRGWESIETLRGQQFDLLVLDEVASMRNFWLHWQEVLRPTLTDTEGEALFISTPKGFNHFFELFSKDPVQPKVKGIDQDNDYKSYHFTSYDNQHLPIDELNKAKLELTEDRFAQEYMADFRKMEGLVYKEFDRQKHVYSDTVFNPIETLVGIDWGWTNPAVVLKIIKDTDNNFFVSKEWYKTQKTTMEIIEIAKSYQGNKYYPDPAEPDRLEEARKAGLNVREVTKDVEAGINAVRELLKTNRLFIHQDCTNLIAEFETYRYPEKKPDKNEPEEPVKENDHAVDALRYVLYMQATHGNQVAHTYYSQSILAQHGAPPIPMQNAPKVAFVYKSNL
jgi:PBSX family phage terminase large subunit